MTEPSAEALLQHAGFLRALARSLLLDEGHAEDVVQEAYLAAVRRPPPPAGARGWLAAVTRNLALKRLRTETRARQREAALARERAHPAADDVAQRLETHRRLVDAVQRLDEPYRSAIVRRYFDDRPPREIARDLGIPVRAVETRLRRAIERLRGDLDAAHAGDRRAWSLPLLALLPLPRTLVPTTLLGVLMGKTQLIIAGAVAVLCFVAGWTLKSDGGRAARGARESTAAIPPNEMDKLKHELAAERSLRLEAEEKLRVASEAEERGAGGPPAETADMATGPRFSFREYDKIFAEIDWSEVGTTTAKLAPLLVELLEQLEKTGEMSPELVGEIQKWNSQLVTVAMKVRAAGIPGHGVNGSFTHPAVEANVIHATLKAGNQHLSADQEARLEEVARRYAAEEDQRHAAYPEGTLALRKLAEEAAAKDRFYAEVDELMTPAQRDFLHPEAVRGYTQLDLFSSGMMTFMDMRPLDFTEREAAVRQVTSKHFERFGLDPTARPVVEQLVRRWAERVAEAGLDAPRERSFAMLPNFTRAERVRKAAQLQLELWQELERRVALTDEQRRKIAAETNIVVPFR